jgi:hypothetical protein
MCFLQILTNYLQKLNHQLYFFIIFLSIYSMLKSMKNMKHNIDVDTYLKLQVFFLKRKLSGLKVKIPKF